MTKEKVPENYDPTKFNRPSVTVDMIIFTIKDDDLKVLLVNRDEDPFKGYWALPGGFIKMDESLDNSAKRILERETGVTNVYLEQLYTFGEPERDPRTRVITICYFAIVNSDEVEISDDVNVKWFSIYDLPDLAFDHNDIAKYAHKRLRWKLGYTPAVFSFLPEKFTLTELQRVYEIVFNKKFDKRNFRKKVKKINLVKETGERKEDVSHRPPRLYKANKDPDEIVEII
ncbi:MAG: NUDIX domain-containing protein [Candidatus Aenigmatarchaeota archaeon]